MTPDQIRRSWDDDDTPRSVFPEPLAERLTRENKELRAEVERWRKDWQGALDDARRYKSALGALVSDLRGLADELARGGPAAADAAMTHEPRWATGQCKCGTPLGDGIDFHWHLANQSVGAAGRFLRARLDKHAGGKGQPGPEGHAPGCGVQPHEGPCFEPDGAPWYAKHLPSEHAGEQP